MKSFFWQPALDLIEPFQQHRFIDTSFIGVKFWTIWVEIVELLCKNALNHFRHGRLSTNRFTRSSALLSYRTLFATSFLSPGFQLWQFCHPVVRVQKLWITLFKRKYFSSFVIVEFQQVNKTKLTLRNYWRSEDMTHIPTGCRCCSLLVMVICISVAVDTRKNASSCWET